MCAMKVFFFIAASASTLTCAGSAEPGETPPKEMWADVKVLDKATAASAELLVQNQANSPVTLANCLASHAVPAGGSLKLTLDGVVGYWVVPDGLAWDCDSGPFEFFYIAANLSGPEVMAGVGFGAPLDDVDPSEASSAEEAQKGDESNVEGEVEEQREGDVDEEQEMDKSKDIVGVELALATDGDGVRGVRCRADLCSSSTTASSLPAMLELNIMGPKSSVLSFWYGWGGHHHHGHHHHHGYHHHHHGHHHHHHHRWYVSSHLIGVDSAAIQAEDEQLKSAAGLTCGMSKKSWFCAGSTKIKCCKRRGGGWTQCGSVQRWHSCW